MVFGLFKKKTKRSECPVFEKGYEFKINLGDEKRDNYLDFPDVEFLQYFDCDFCKTKLALVYDVKEEKFSFFDDKYETELKDLEKQKTALEDKIGDLEESVSDLEDKLEWDGITKEESTKIKGEKKTKEKEIEKLNKLYEKLDDKEGKLDDKREERNFKWSEKWADKQG